MPITNILILELAPTIARAILAFWFRDPQIVADSAASLVDVLKSRTSDVIAQQRAKRQFEEIGERVVESILPIFELEGVAFDEGQKSLIARSVTETLKHARIDATLLARRNLDPNELAAFLMESVPMEVKDLSDDEKTLYRRIIFESSQLIVDIASFLPSFTERTLAEVLKRENDLLDSAALVVQEMKRIRETSSNMQAEKAQFETDYRLSIARSLDKVELFGVNVSPASRRQRLSVAYVTLSVLGQNPESVQSSNWKFWQSFANSSIRNRTLGADEIQMEQKRGLEAISVNKVLSKSLRLYVSGLAGSGKTTLLQWIAVRSALRDFPIELVDWNDSIPFFIRLRQFGDTELPSPEDFPRLVAPMIAARMPDGWAHAKLLEPGHSIVLIDGVDELPEGRQREAYEWLDLLLQTFPYARYVVTSRPYAVSEDWIEGNNFEYAELQPMELAAIDEFIDHWHDAVRLEALDDEARSELNTLSSSLKETIRVSRPIKNFANNPLLCAMLCALHRDRRRQLPTERVEIYEAACYMLLERYDVERRIDLRNYPHLTYQQKRVLLQDLAYWMLKNSWSEVSRERCEERFFRRLDSVERVPRNTRVPEVYRLLVERSGLVREPIPGKIDFIHRTFQEFFAAREALDEGDIGVLINNAHNEQWREVVILAAGLAGRHLCNELIKGLLERGIIEDRYRQRLHLLATACLETAIELDQDVRRNVQNCMRQLIPPKLITEAPSLASAGELAVPHLRAHRDYNEMTAAACVRTLVSIGGDSAFVQLLTYAEEKRDLVFKELLRGWDNFERREYAKKILSPCLIARRGTALRLERAASLDGFEYLTTLTELIVNDCKPILDLEPLSGLTGLIQLELNNAEYIRDLTPIATLIYLMRLSLKGFIHVTDLSPLAGLTGLSYLNLSGCSAVHDLSPIVGLIHLHTLDLSDCKAISDFGPLHSLHNLKTLGMSNLDRIHLRGLPKGLQIVRQ